MVESVGRTSYLQEEQPTTLMDKNNQQLCSRTGKLTVESVGRTSYLLVSLGRTTHHVDGQEQSTVTEQNRLTNGRTCRQNKLPTYRQNKPPPMLMDKNNQQLTSCNNICLECCHSHFVAAKRKEAAADIDDDEDRPTQRRQHFRSFGK